MQTNAIRIIAMVTAITMFQYNHKQLQRTSIVGSVVEFSPATRETGVRFPDNARFSKYMKIAILGCTFEMALPLQESPVLVPTKLLAHLNLTSYLMY